MTDESITNCPNCGSALTEKEGYLSCAYCGTTIYDFATLDTEKPFYIRVKTRQGVFLSKVKCVTTEMQIPIDTPCLLDEEERYRMMLGLLNKTLTMTFDVLQEDKERW